MIGQVVVVALALWAIPLIAGAQWVVNTHSDTDDGVCDAAHCSLREAIQGANATAGADAIHFAIPAENAGCDANGVCTIRPDSMLPTLRDGGTTIDGFTQPGAQANGAVGLPLTAVWKIVLDGSGLDGCCFPGLHSTGRGNRIRGLRVQGFYDGIYVEDTDGNRVEGNAAVGNQCVGVLVSSAEGGPGAASNVVGGADPAARNLIGGNGCVGVGLGPGRFNHVLGNVVGLAADGSTPLGNHGDGVRVFGAAIGYRIGGSGMSEANVVAFNREHGINIDGSFGASRISLSRNSIYANGDGAVLLTAGANDGIAAPVIDQVGLSMASGSACAGCSVEVFSDTAEQGRLFEGATITDASGRWSLIKLIELRGPFLTATATDALGNTSRLSAAVRLLPLTPTASRTATPRRTATVTAPPATATPIPCYGDCNGNGEVSVDELVRAVNIALGSQSLGTCPASDSDLSGEVTIDELLLAVTAALNGCV